MKAYCAFIRGVNVNGRIMKMVEACDVLKQAGLTSVVSVLASGNLIFESDRPQSELKGLIQSALSEYYGYDIYLFVKSSDEVSAILSVVPFAEDSEFHIYTYICEPGFEDVLLSEYMKIDPSDNESAVIRSGLFYWRCRKGATLNSSFSKILGRKDMKEKFTSRNIGTIAKIVAKMNT